MASAGRQDLDRELSGLSADELRDVLEEVVNHEKPESEKCSLVRRLKEEASKDEHDSHHHHVGLFGHDLPSANNFKGRKTMSALSRTMTAQSLGRSGSGPASNNNSNSSQSLQDLASSESVTARGSSSTVSSSLFKSCPSGGASVSERKLIKATRANSFSLASNSPNCSHNVPELSQTRSSSASGCGGGTSTWTNNAKKSPSLASTNNNISTTTLSSSAASSSLNDYSCGATTNSVLSNIVHDVNDKNNNDCDHNNRGMTEGESARHPHPNSSSNSSLKTYSQASSHPHHSPSGASCEQSNNFVESSKNCTDGQYENAIEMEDLRKQAKFVNYSSAASASSLHNNNSVDSVIQFSDLNTREADMVHYAQRVPLDNSGDESSLMRTPMNQVGDNLNDPVSAGVRSAIAPANPAVKPIKRKVKPEEPIVLAEHIDGNIGNKDIEFLVHYIGGENSQKMSSVKVPASSSAKDPNRKKEKSINGKEPRKRAVTEGAMTNGSLDEDQREGESPDDDKFEKFEFIKSQTFESPITSPTQAPSIASCAEYGPREEFSEEEVAYHSDREAGFVPYNSRKRKFRPNQKISSSISSTIKARSVGNSSFASAASSPLSNTPSVISASSIPTGPAATNCRGYESEREYSYPEDHRAKQVTRRKVVSSMPHSEQNSPENSDVDSSLSLPAGRRPLQTNVPKVLSYAEMAAASSVAAIVKPLTELTLETNVPSEAPESVPSSSSHHVANQVVAASDRPCQDSEVQQTHSDANPKASSHHRSPPQQQQTPPISTHQPRPSSSSLSTHVKVKSNEKAEPASGKKAIITKSNEPVTSIEGDVADLPPVMFDDEKAVDTAPSTTSFTFGFFDDPIPLDTNELVVSLPFKATKESDLISSPEEVKKAFVFKSFGPDVDTNTFNYNEILCYIRGAWETVARSSLESLKQVGSEWTSGSEL